MSARPPDPLDALRRLLDHAPRVVPFTGAGLSTECGVPDFRTPGSPWTVNKPIPFAAFVASEAVRAEAWRRKFTMDDTYAHALPGRGHRALARLLAGGRAPAIVTQNIDDLQQRAGAPEDGVVELHGNGTYARCLGCGARAELAVVRPIFEASGRAPDCPACGGLLKSATVSFGQAMPGEAMRRARAAMLGCDLVLVVGSSLVVHPAASLPLLAREAGARLAIINREPTPLDAAADVVLRAEAGDALGALFGAGARDG